MNSFYGGPAGQSFEIKAIFPTYYGADGLLGDINKGWKSSIAVGEYVMISYGEPSSDKFIANRDSDLAYAASANDPQKSYNSTLWRKGYDESAGGTGIVYTLISTLTGFTPRITASVKETLAPGSGAKAEVDTTRETYPDQVEIELSIPGSWNFDKGVQDIVEANVDVLPAVELRNIGSHGTNEAPDQAYLGRFKFTLPKSQNLLGIGVQVIEGVAHPEYDILDVGEKPKAYIITETENKDTVQGYYIIESYDSNNEPIYKKDGSGANILYTPTINTPILRVQLPQSQNLKEQVPVTHVKPSVTEADIRAWLDKTDVNNPVLNITIPNTWQFELADTILVNPGEDPGVTMAPNANGTHQILTFTLPRTGKFYQAATLPAVDDTYHDGDIVIVTSNNTIYELVDGDWVAKGTLLPSFNGTSKVNALDPYDAATKEAVKPTVELEQAADGTWSFTFGLPTAPLAEVTETKTLGPAEDATAAVEVSGADKLGFKFGIPRGSKMYSGTTEPGDAITGDYWLNTDTGDLYEYKESGKVAVANLVGPTGAALNFIADLGEQASIEAAIAVLDANYSDATSEQLYSANIADDSGNIAYWFYKTAAQVGVAGAWTYSQLTGAVDSFIARVYVESDDKAYSATYVNSLIEGLDTETGEKKTYSQAKIDELLKALDETLNTWGRFADLPDLTTTT